MHYHREHIQKICRRTSGFLKFSVDEIVGEVTSLFMISGLWVTWIDKDTFYEPSHKKD